MQTGRSTVEWTCWRHLYAKILVRDKSPEIAKTTTDSNNIQYLPPRNVSLKLQNKS